ncbi:Ankyrin repeat and SOCS box protein 18 [Bagarius yarrelli]|uniref:Ankyrin repeat and SOCS box protein 18 n=1 Tax=Bagarius yarrelli TaxID=175774 RepID=A0A556UZ64_BAGYA|nr:Ankyrin repeat and SOCS box protein 18 [Bagarius yarrelli]
MSSDVKVDYPLNSEITQTLKVAREKKDFKCLESLLKDLTKENPDAVIELSNDDWMKETSVQLPAAVLVVIMISQDEEVYVMSHVAATACVKDSKCLAVNRTKSKSDKEKKSGKQPGMDFVCPSVLVNMLSHHWRDVQDGFSDPAELNKILVFQSDELRWTAQKRGEFELDDDEDEDEDDNIALGLWSLEYRQELTSPLCIAAAQGFTDCLLYLLEHGAHPNLNAGGKAALHEACSNNNTECAELLLEHGAEPNQLTEDGLAPLHLCRTPQSLRCAKALVRHGANVDLPTEEEEDTPLLVAARHGLPHHVQLFLRYGAKINHTNSSGETALGAACSEAQKNPGEDQFNNEGHLQVCNILLSYGAEVNLSDNEKRTPLHKAARNVQMSLVQCLLDHGADINAIDYNGCTPLSIVLQIANLRQESQPEVVVQTLLNHGSIKVWPQALLKVGIL